MRCRLLRFHIFESSFRAVERIEMPGWKLHATMWRRPLGVGQRSRTPDWAAAANLGLEGGVSFPGEAETAQAAEDW